MKIRGLMMDPVTNMPIVILNIIHEGLAAGYNITTQALYTKQNVAKFERFVQ